MKGQWFNATKWPITIVNCILKPNLKEPKSKRIILFENEQLRLCSFD